MSADPDASSKDAAATIGILLEEYRTLRDEIKVHLAGQFTVLTYTLTATGIVAGLARSKWAIGVAAVVGAVGLYGYFMTVREVIQLGTAVAILEMRINRLAGRAYGTRGDLLSWETCHRLGPSTHLNPLWKLLRRREAVKLERYLSAADHEPQPTTDPGGADSS